MASEKDKTTTTGTWLDLGLEIFQQILAASAEEAAKKAEESGCSSANEKSSPTEEVRKNARVALSDDYLQIKELRRLIDACIQKAQERRNSLMFNRGCSEIDTAIVKLKEAKMWCGQAMGELGHKLPAAYRDEAD